MRVRRWEKGRMAGERSELALMGWEVVGWLVRVTIEEEKEGETAL